MWFIELRLSEIGQKMFITAVAIDDQDFLTAVAGHLVRGFLQERQLHASAVGHRSGFMFGFGDLSEVVFGENHRVFFFGGVKRCVADVEQVRAKREVWAMLFEDSERE